MHLIPNTGGDEKPLIKLTEQIVGLEDVVLSVHKYFGARPTKGDHMIS